MDENEFEGSIVLEKLNEIGKLDEFFEVIDADNFEKAKSLMIEAELDQETISLVLKKMNDADENH